MIEIGLMIRGAFIPESIAWFTVVVMAVSLLVNYRLISDELFLRRYVPEAKTYRDARIKRKDIFRVTDNANICETYVLDKKDKKDVELNDKGGSGIQIDPSFLSGVESIRHKSGTIEYEYAINSYFPVGNKGKRAVLAILEHIRTEHPDISFIHNNMAVLDLLGYPSNHLKYNCEKIIKGYLDLDEDDEEPEQFDTAVADLVSTIETIKKEISAKGFGLKPGFYPARTALNAIPIGRTAEDTARIIKVVLNKAQHSGWDDIPKWVVAAGFGVMGLIGVIALGFFIIRSAPGMS